VASLEEYLRGAKVSGRQGKEYESLVKSLKSLGSTQSTAEALGVDTGTDVPMGAMDFLISPERGVLTAPGRGIRMAVGGKEAASGFGNVGGLKIQRGDSPLAQAGKLFGAFTLDVVTDPLSYIGAPTSIGRASVSKIASSLGGTALKSLSKSANIPEKQLIEFLADRSRVGQAAKIQREVGMGGEDVQGLASRLIGENPRKYAEMELGSILGDSLYTRGRRGIVADLANVARQAGADEQTAARAARAVFSELPEEVVGGLRFLNPVTGKSLVRFSPSTRTGLLETTGLGAVADLANRARFGIARAANLGSTKYLSGRSGPILQGAKRGAKGVTELPDPSLGRVRIGDWSAFNKFLANREDILKTLQTRYMVPTIATLGRAQNLEKELGVEAKDAYVDLLFQNLNSSKATPTPGTADIVVTNAAEDASAIRASMNELMEELRDAGIEVGDISPNFFPLMFTKETAAAFKQTARSGRVSTGYTGTGGRKFGFKVISDADEGAEFGFLLEGFDDVYIANPKVAGELVAERLKAQGYEGVTSESFVTDPIAAITSYMDVMTKRLSIKRTADNFVELGLGIRDVSQTTKRLNDRAITTLGSVLGTLSPAARKAAERSVEAAQKELIDTAAGATGLAASLRQARDEAESVYLSAKNSEKVAAKTAREARDALAKASVSPRELVKILRKYAESGADITDVADAQRIAGNAQSRAARATLKADEAQAALDDIEILAKTLDERFEAAAAKKIDEQVDNAMDELLSATEAQTFAASARQFAGTMSAARAEVEGSLGSAAAKRFSEIEQASIRQADAAQAYANATLARRKARADYDSLNNKTAIQKSGALDTIIGTYLNARAVTAKARLDGADSATMSRLLDIEMVVESTLRKALSQNKSLKGDVAEYAEKLEGVVDKLNRAEFEVAAVLSSEDKLRDVVEAYGATFRTPEELNAAFTDLVESYNVIRSKITPEELKLLSPEQRQVYGAGTEGLITRVTERSDFGKELSKNLGNPNAALHPIGGAFEDIYAPLEIKESLDLLYDMTNRPSEWKRKIDDYVDPGLMLWRLQVTLFRGPAFTLLNLAGGTFNNMLGGVSLANSQRSARTVKSLIEATYKTGREFPTTPTIARQKELESKLRKLIGDAEYDEFQAFIVRGGSDTSSTMEQIRQASRLGTEASQLALTRRGSRALSMSQEPTTAAGRGVRSTVDWLLTNRVSGFVGDANLMAETYMRYAAFKQGFQKFKNYDAAMDLSFALHFDYGDLSQAETWVRRLVPFYVWSRNNIPLQVRSMFLQPGKITKFLYAREEIENAYGSSEEWMNTMLPEYAQIGGAFGLNVGDQTLFFSDRMPYMDVDRTFQLDKMPLRTRELANMVGPVAGLYGILGGVDTGTGRAFDPAGTPAPLWAQPLAAAGLLSRNASGEALIPEELASLVNEIIPSLGVAERATSGILGIGPTSQTDRRLSNALNVLGISAAFGQSAGTLTPRTARGELRRRQEILNNRIISAAEENNVDLDWVRAQIRNGVDPVAVLAAIQSGQGRNVSESDLPVGITREDQEALSRLVERLQR